MKILAPVRSVKEAEVLIHEGAEELYCGLHPKAWSKSHGRNAWLNRRGPGTANIESIAELEQLTHKAHDKKAEIFLALNQPSYSPERYSEILDLIKEVTENVGIDAVIMADPGLIMASKKKFPDLSVHVSSLAAVLNSSAVSFFLSMGVSRIVFPRYFKVEEIAAIIEKAGSKVEYEVFMYNDGCIFEEGFCHVSHAFGGAFCHNPRWSYKLIKEGEIDNTEERKSFESYLRNYREWLFFAIKNGNEIPTYTGYPLGMCGLCALPELKDMGVTSLKIVGREAPLIKKQRSVKLVNEVIKVLDEAKTEDIRKKAKLIRGSKNLCETGFMCYFR